MAIAPTVRRGGVLGRWFGVGLVLCSFGSACTRSPVPEPPQPSRFPEVAVPLDLPPQVPETEDTEVPPPKQEEAPPPGRGGPGQGPQGTAPDPPALRSRVQYELDLRYDRGAVELVDAREVHFPSPVVTARRMGRFAIELWIGLELVERVRFDFPLLGAEEPRDVSLEGGLVARQTVLVPATDRPTRALIVDRATGEEIEFPWPPVQGKKPSETGDPE